MGHPGTRRLHRSPGPAGHHCPDPRRVTGILGGYLFGEWLGLLYSTIGVGRWLGAHYVRTLVSLETWDKMGFIVEAEGACD